MSILRNIRSANQFFKKQVFFYSLILEIIYKLFLHFTYIYNKCISNLPKNLFICHWIFNFPVNFIYFFSKNINNLYIVLQKIRTTKYNWMNLKILIIGSNCEPYLLASTVNLYIKINPGLPCTLIFKNCFKVLGMKDVFSIQVNCFCWKYVSEQLYTCFYRNISWYYMKVKFLKKVVQSWNINNDIYQVKWHHTSDDISVIISNFSEIFH